MSGLLAILGRGIQKLKADAPSEDISSWVLTEDLEVCDVDSAHLPVRVPIDDSSPYCMVGGGELNAAAGAHLSVLNKPEIVVCAYGDRSNYLKSVNGPADSEVMNREFHRQFNIIQPVPRYIPSSVVWSREKSLDGPSNTGQEIRNIFDLALERELKNVDLVTIGVHAPRTWTYVSKLQSRHHQYRDLSINLFDSEEVLLQYDHSKHAHRVEALRNSKAFGRTWEREALGISKIVRNVYSDVRPKVDPK